MKKIDGFNKFLEKLILEDNRKGHGITKLPFILSNKLKKILMSIKHPIAKKLVEKGNNRDFEKVTLLDVDNNIGKISLINSNKVFDNIIDLLGVDTNHEVIINHLKTSSESMMVLHDYWKKNRVSVKIGSLIGKLFPNEFKQGGDPGNDIESFVNEYIALSDNTNRFKIVSGDDIIKYYNYNNNDTTDEDGNDRGVLVNSCMRYDRCKEYIEFYAKNDVEMLILFSDIKGREDKIIGRAILWKLEEPKDRIFMDRVYYKNETDLALFKEYATKNGWLYKKKQNMQADGYIIDTKNETQVNINLVTKNTFEKTGKYPYMDTMKYFDIDNKILTNDDDIEGNIYVLEDTMGNYTSISNEYMEDENRTYIGYYEEWYDNEDITYCDLGEEYRTLDDAIYINNEHCYATEEWYNNNMVYSDYSGEDILLSDSIWSDYNNSNIDKNFAMVMSESADVDSIDDVIVNDDDYRHIDEEGNSAFSYTNDKNGMLYNFDNSEKKYFVFVITASDGHLSHTKIAKHKIWDADKLYKFNNEWYFDFDDGKTKDIMMGQKRLWDNKNISKRYKHF